MNRMFVQNAWDVGEGTGRARSRTLTLTIVQPVDTQTDESGLDTRVNGPVELGTLRKISYG